jgi:hypothetical protein
MGREIFRFSLIVSIGYQIDALMERHGIEYTHIFTFWQSKWRDPSKSKY